MNIFNQAYYRTLAENEQNLKFWEAYLQNLQNLNFNTYSDKLRVPALIPIGSRVLFRGEIKHTNEVTVALGQGYFVKCSVAQAEILRQHRIKDAKSKVELYKQEKNLLENRLYFSKQTIYDDEGKEIIEPYDEEEDKKWREEHRKHIRELKQNKNVGDNETEKTGTDEELWNRLEELEIQEELENELQDKAEECNFDKATQNNNLLITDVKLPDAQPTDVNGHNDESKSNVGEKKRYYLEQIKSKQQELENMLLELKHKDRIQSNDDSDLMKILDEMEGLEGELDKLIRLEDALKSNVNNDEEDDVDDEDDDESDNSIETSDTENATNQKIKRSVSFAVDESSETIDITFKHTDVKPNTEKYNPKQGLNKPSDIYEAYSNLFETETVSILKKMPKNNNIPDSIEKNNNKDNVRNESKDSNSEEDVTKTSAIVVRDVVEKSGDSAITASKARPTSLFKKRRQQKKSQ